MFADAVWSFASRVLPLMAAAALVACGGSGDGQLISTPQAPTFLSVRIEEQALTLNWNVPPEDGGAPVLSYLVTIEAPEAGFRVASVTNQLSTVVQLQLRVGVQYSISVAAQNRVGTGAPATSGIKLLGSTPTGVAAFDVEGDTPPSAAVDPSILKTSSGTLWMAYQRDQDSSIRLARSDDGGRTYQFSSTLVLPELTTVTDTDAQLRACGANTCNGRWVYEMPRIVEDAADPDANRRFKLFARQYFVTPASTAKHLGSIVMWTAATPDSDWSAPTSVLGSFLTPPELLPANLINAMHGEVSDCNVVTKGGAVLAQNSVDLVLTCADSGKVVLLRTTDHAKTFQYAATIQ